MNSSVNNNRTETPATDTIPEKVEASMAGTDEPMERDHPRAPGALVWFTYPILLVIVLFLAVMGFMFFLAD